MTTIDKVLIADAIALLLFTISMIVIFCIFQSIPDTLVGCFYGCAGSEGFITLFIWYIKKKDKKRTGKGDKDNER